MTKQLKNRRKNQTTDTEKAFNLLKSIGITVEKGGTANPYLRSIAEKAETISSLYQQRQKDTEETLEELKELVKEITKAKKERAEKNMPKDVFSAYWILKNEELSNAEEIANQMIPTFEKYPLSLIFISSLMIIDNINDKS